VSCASLVVSSLILISWASSLALTLVKCLARTGIPSSANVELVDELSCEDRVLGFFCLVGVLSFSSSESIKIGVPSVEPGVEGDLELEVDDVSGVRKGSLSLLPAFRLRTEAAV
jgi:hypothetical protein